MQLLLTIWCLFVWYVGFVRVLGCADLCLLCWVFTWFGLIVLLRCLSWFIRFIVSIVGLVWVLFVAWFIVVRLVY